MTLTDFILRPGVANRNSWFPERPKQSEWTKIRASILNRDNYTCISCGHQAYKWMHVHHLDESAGNDESNLRTLCAACHAVTHMGFSLQRGFIEIWKSPISQVDIVRVTRNGVRQGKLLDEIKGELALKRGRRAPDSIRWANSLVEKMEYEPHAELPEPLCAVFVEFTRWQIDTHKEPPIGLSM